MGHQLTSNAEALRLFFTEDIYLVADEDPTLPLVQQLDAKADFEFLGKNQKQVLILVNDHQHEVSTAEGRELLRKLVKAIGLTANDFALVNYAAYSAVSYATLSAFFNCKLMMAFGVTATKLGVPDQVLNQLAHYNGAQLLFAQNLHDLDADQPSKKTLWQSLQQLAL